MSAYTLGLMTEADVEQIAAIEKATFSDPWSKESLLHELNENPMSRYLVVRDGEEVLAYAGMWLVLGEANITNVAVRADLRGQGLGETVLRALIQLAADSGMVSMTLEVRRSNAVAQNLYRKVGFVGLGYRKNYYENSEDALIMQLDTLPEGHPENDPMLVVEEEEES